MHSRFYFHSHPKTDPSTLLQNRRRKESSWSTTPPLKVRMRQKHLQQQQQQQQQHLQQQQQQQHIFSINRHQVPMFTARRHDVAALQHTFFPTQHSYHFGEYFQNPESGNGGPQHPDKSTAGSRADLILDGSGGGGGGGGAAAAAESKIMRKARR